MSRKKIDWIFFLILALAAALRLYNLGAESIWYDEISVVNRMTRGLSYLLYGGHQGPPHFLVMRLFTGVFGVSAAALRLPSVIFSLLSLALIYKLAFRLFNEKTALVSALLFAISPFNIFYSQDASYYSLYLFLALLSVWLFVKILYEDESGYAGAIGYVIVSILACLTSVLSILIIFVQNIIFFLRKKTFSRRWIFLQLVIFLSVVIWFTVMSGAYFTRETEFFHARTGWIQMPDSASLIDTFKTFCYGGERYGGSDVTVSLTPAWIPIALSSILTVFFFIGLLRSKDYTKALLLLLWIVVPISVLYVYSVLVRPLYVIRYLIYCVPAFYITVGIGIADIRNRYLRLGMVLAIVLMMAVPLQAYYAQDLKIPWRDIIADINSQSRKGDLVIVSEAKQVQLFGYYGEDGALYFGKAPEALGANLDLIRGGTIHQLGKYSLVGVNDASQLSSVPIRTFIENNNRLWLLLTRWSRNSESIKAYIEDRRPLRLYRRYDGAALYYCPATDADRKG
ncbi:MAG: glycosyltransferase family 39 protein [Candidatus Omnitrophica bacterium]|nr:glycosyltransferase family 39 protein [Candidatus Omnitrophota bacterium]